MMQVIKQTDEEKMAMYMKMPKKKIAEMLIQCNKVLDTQYGAKVFSSNAVLAVTSDSTENNKESEVAVAFAKWITVYASQLGNGWVMVKGTESIMMTSEQLFEEYKTQMAKATDR